MYFTFYIIQNIFWLLQEGLSTMDLCKLVNVVLWKYLRPEPRFIVSE